MTNAETIALAQIDEILRIAYHNGKDIKTGIEINKARALISNVVRESNK